MNSITPHEHICLIDENPSERLQPLDAIVAEKLADGYRCVCLLDERSFSAYRGSLNSALASDDESSVSESLSCVPVNGILAGEGDPASAIREFLREECALVRAAGMSGILIWLAMGEIPPDCISIRDVVDLLATSNAPERATVIYGFDRAASPPTRVLDALRQLPLVYIDGNVRQNPFYQVLMPTNGDPYPDQTLTRLLRQLHDAAADATVPSGPALDDITLLDAIPDPFFTIDREQRFLFVNATAQRHWKRWSNDLIGTPLWDAFPNAVGIFGYDQIQRSIEDGIPRQFEVDSSYLGYWTEVRLLPFQDGLAITYRDISQRKATEEALSTRARQQAVVAELGRQALGGISFERLLQQTVSAIGDMLDVEYVNVLELVPEEPGLRLVAGLGWREGLVGNVLLDTGTASLAGFTLLVGEPVIVEDLTQETRFRKPQFLIEHGVRSGISVVIGGQERPYGVLGAHTRQMVGFTQDDVNFLQAVANILGTAVDHDRAQQLQRHHTAIVESSGDAIIGETLEGIITSWNDAARLMFGYSESEVIGQPITLIYPPEESAGAQEILTQVREGRRIEQMETIRRRKSGELFDVSVSVSPIRDTSGRIIGAAKIERDISDRKREEAARRASEERLQLALDAGNMGTWDWDLSTGALQWSPNMVEMHGLQPDDFKGRFEDFSQRVHPDDRDRIMADIEATLNGDQLFRAEYRNLRPDGSIQWLEARGRVTRGRLGQPDHMSGVCIDVTEQVQSRQQIARFAAATVAERDQLQQVIDVIPEGVVIITSEGQIGMSNDAARDIWADQLVDINVREQSRADISPDPNQPRDFADLPIWRSLLAGEFVIGEQIVVQREGMAEPIQLLLNSAPLRDERGRITAAVTTFQDITAIKDFERQKDEFLQTISHDLKNPLTSIKGNAQLLRRRENDGASGIVPIVERIEGSTDQAAALIDELLDITRLQMGRPLDLVRKPTPINDLVRRIVEEFLATSDGHRFTIVARHEMIIGSIDELRIARVLSNLLSNAVKYSDPESEIVITTSIPEVAGEWLEISVHDHGIGIPASDLPNLFQSFRRGSNVQGYIHGSGLGLASSKQIVEQHGGTISVESEEGRGSTFTVRLPLAALADVETGPNSN